MPNENRDERENSIQTRRTRNTEVALVTPQIEKILDRIVTRRQRAYLLGILNVKPSE